MEAVDRALRRTILGTAVVLTLRFDTIQSQYVFLVSALTGYTLLAELLLFRHKTVSTAVSQSLAIFDFAFISWMFVTFQTGIIAAFFIAELVVARARLDRRTFVSAVSVGAACYLSTVCARFALGHEPVRLLVMEVVLYPGITVAAFYYITRVHRNLLRGTQAEHDELLRRLDTKNERLSTMSHEIRTPLTIITSSSQILLEERPGQINATQRRFLETIFDSTARLIDLAEDALAEGKVESAWPPLRLQEMDIRPLLRKLVQGIAPILEQSGQSLRYWYPHMLSTVLVDSRWIQQTLINLIHNASKYTGRSGSILVSAKENEECVVISVSDDGCGIQEARQTDVFEKYYREQPLQSCDVNGGVGLGLAIVKHVVELHSGQVYVQSAPGIGSKFSFTLPICRRRFQ